MLKEVSMSKTSVASPEAGEIRLSRDGSHVWRKTNGIGFSIVYVM